ncbi:MAG: hypothetical protein ACE5IR_24960 [bacterium]
MKTSQFLEEDELIEQAISVLMEKLGPVETKRFLTIATPKRLDSVVQHRKWQATLDKDRFFDQVFEA